MGCISSRDAEEILPDNPAKPAPHSRPKSSKPVPVAQPSNVYETQGVASLVGNAPGKPAFHGLLTGRSRPLLQYEQTVNDAPQIPGACHPLDDSFAPPMGYDPNHNVLAVSDIVMSLHYTVIVSDNPDREGYLRKVIHDVFDLIHSVANGWSETSEIAQVNNLKPEKPLEISQHLAEIFDIVDELHDVTDGRFDPTAGVLKLAFLEALTDLGRPPLPGEVSRFRFAMGWRKKVKRDGNILRKVNANTIVDLDGMSKGFCIDLIVASLHRAGYENFYVDWAGDIRAVGRHPSGRAWRTAIMNPPPLPRLFDHWKHQSLNTVLTDKDIGYIVNLEQHDATNVDTKLSGFNGVALATSGDYFQIQKFGYHHIMRADDLTAMKASIRSTGSVSVLASSCAIADGLATAAMTFDSPQSAASFLDSVIERMTGRVFGYCIIGRSSDGNSTVYCTPEFSPYTSSTVSEASSTSKSMNLDVPHDAVSADDLAKIQQSIVRVPGRLTWSSGFIDIDALTPCSMKPDAKVSFIIPGKLSDTIFVFSTVANIRGDIPERLHFAYLGGEHGGKPEYNSVQFTLHISNVYNYDGISLVIAKVVEVFKGESEAVSYSFGDGDPRSVSLQHSVMRDDFVYRSVVDQAKETFSELPSTVCVITTESADGSQFGLTATSLAISDHATNLFCFNVMHTSTFFAAFSGQGSIVTIYCLASGKEAFAKTFASNCLIQPSMKQALEEASICVLKGVVQLVKTVEDHAIVLAQISGSTFLNDALSPLLWQRRKYCSL